MRCYRCERPDLKPEDFSPGNNRCRKCHTEYQAERRARIGKDRSPVDRTGTKVCSTCQLEKPKTEFGIANSLKDGLQPQCNGCRGKTRKKYNTNVKGHVQNMVAGARRRSKLVSREFNITVEDVEALWTSQEGKCKVTGIPMELDNDTVYYKHSRNLFGPSLDRINSAGGYSSDNIQLILTAVNNGLNHWGIEVFKDMAISLAQKSGYTVIAPSAPTPVN